MELYDCKLKLNFESNLILYISLISSIGNANYWSFDEILFKYSVKYFHIPFCVVKVHKSIYKTNESSILSVLILK